MYSTPQRVKTAQKNGRLSTDPYGTGFSMERQRFQAGSGGSTDQMMFNK